MPNYIHVNTQGSVFCPGFIYLRKLLFQFLARFCKLKILFLFSSFRMSYVRNYSTFLCITELLGISLSKFSITGCQQKLFKDQRRDTHSQHCIKQYIYSLNHSQHQKLSHIIQFSVVMTLLISFSILKITCQRKQYLNAACNLYTVQERLLFYQRLN